MIILDLGSGNTCRNDVDYARKMVKAVADLGIKDAVIKWQLFISAGANTPLSRKVFDDAFGYATSLGIKTTASVFDEDSLYFLLRYPVPFVKIANCPASKSTIPFIMGDIKAIISTDNPKIKYSEDQDHTTTIYTVSKYPAEVEDYDVFGDKLKNGISDHTDNFDLYHKHKPKIYECHFKLDDSTGLDAGAFARTPTQVRSGLK
jgi:sialic acid synthase SpsE